MLHTLSAMLSEGWALNPKIMRHRCYYYMRREGEGDGEREGKEREEDLFMATSCIHNEFNTADVR